MANKHIIAATNYHRQNSACTFLAQYKPIKWLKNIEL